MSQKTIRIHHKLNSFWWSKERMYVSYLCFLLHTDNWFFIIFRFRCYTDVWESMTGLQGFVASNFATTLFAHFQINKVYLLLENADRFCLQLANREGLNPFAIFTLIRVVFWWRQFSRVSKKKNSASQKWLFQYER